VLGRDAKFDPQQDAVVRVDAHHLRKRLKQYYAGPGRDHEFHIILPNGQYRLKFVVCPASPADEQKDDEQKELETVDVSTAKPALTRRRTWAWVAIGAVFVVLAAGLAWERGD